MTLTDTETFTDLGASPELITFLRQRGIESPTEIQKLVFAPVLEGKSVLGLSKTGSGKTLAYLLPLVQNLQATLAEGAPQNDAEKSRVLILCPTRELAQQIHSELEQLWSHRAGASLLIVGGESEQDQLNGFASSIFLVATPGRLLDLIKNSALPLDTVQRVVLDEADRLLDMGFQEDIRDILGRVPKGFQLVCLSATLHLGVEELIYEMGVDFVRVNASSDADLTVEGLDHRVAFVGDSEKFHFLANFLKDRQEQRGIIFSNFREAAHRISKRLEGLGYRSEALSAQLSQPQRRRIMDEFRKGALDILVASDVDSRGLDVDALDFVVNFELPDDSATYVHRVGRTARAGRKGVAVSLVGFEDSFRLEKLESYLKSPIDRLSVDTAWLEGPLPRGKHPPKAPSYQGGEGGHGPRRHQEPRNGAPRPQRQGAGPNRQDTHHAPSGGVQRAPAAGTPPAAASSQSRRPHTGASAPKSTSWLQKVWSKVLGIFGVKPARSLALPESRRDSASGPSGDRSRSGHRRRPRRGGGGGGRPHHASSSRGPRGEGGSSGGERPQGRGGPRRDGGRRRPRPAGPRRDGDR